MKTLLTIIFTILLLTSIGCTPKHSPVKGEKGTDRMRTLDKL